MKFFTTAALLASAFSSLAAAAPQHNNARGYDLCLDYAAAEYLVNGWGLLFSNFDNATANVLLADDFTDFSDSVAYLTGKPEGPVTFSSKVAFEVSQTSEPPFVFNLLAIDAVACKTVAFRYEAIPFTGATPVKGINVIYASNKDGTPTGWQIKTSYAEFNSGLYSYEIGQRIGIANISCPAPRA